MTDTAFNLFELDTDSQKRDVRVGYIDPDLGYIISVSRYQANKYAELNPGTQFIVSNRDEVRYLNINEVNKLNINDITPAKQGGPCGEGESAASVDIKISDVDTSPCKKKRDRIRVDLIGGGGVGAQANPVITRDGAIASIDVVHGGFGYKYPPLVQITDTCGVGKGASAISVLGETNFEDEIYNQPEDFELLDFKFGPDEGINFPEVFGSRYNEDAVVIGDWSPSDYANFSKNPIELEIQKYQEFLKVDRKNWWTTRTSRPDSIVGSGRNTLYDVTHWSWGGELIKPEKLTGFVEVPFDIRNVDNSYSKLGIKIQFEAEDGSHSFILDPNFNEFVDDGNNEEEKRKNISDVKLRFIEEGGEYFILATGKGKVEAEVIFTSRDASTNGYAFLTEYDLEEEPFGSRRDSPPTEPLVVQTDDGDLEWFKSLNKERKSNTKTGLFTAGKQYRITAAINKFKPQRGRDPIESKLPIVSSGINEKAQLSYLDNEGNDANASLTFGNLNQLSFADSVTNPGVLQFERVLVKKVKANTTYIVSSVRDRFSIKNQDKIIKEGIIDKEDGQVKISGSGLGSIIFTTYNNRTEYNEDTVVSASRGKFLAKGKEKLGGKTRYEFAYRLDLPQFETRGQIIVNDSFMNTHAVSPVPQSDKPKSANVGKAYSITWKQVFPYTGTYKFKGIADSKSQLTLSKVGAPDSIIDGWELKGIGNIRDLYSYGREPRERRVKIEEGTYRIKLTLQNDGKNTFSQSSYSRNKTIWDSATHKDRATNRNQSRDVVLYSVNASNSKNAGFINKYGVSPVSPVAVERDAGILAKNAEERLDAKFIYENDKVYLKVTGEGRVRVSLRLKVKDNPDVSGLAVTEARIECEGEDIRIRRGMHGDNGTYEGGEWRTDDTKYGAGEFISGKKYRVRLSGGGRDSGIGVRERNKIGIDDNISNGYDENAELEITSVKVLESLVPIITTTDYAGERYFQWDNLKISNDGNYTLTMEADGQAEVKITNKKGNALRSEESINRFTISKNTQETINLVKGDYRIEVTLTQESGKKIKDFNAMKFGLKITSGITDDEELELNNDSWDENPFGVALTIEAPEVSAPVERNPIQIGRCANNPLWSTRFRPRNPDRRWYPVYNGKNDGVAGGRNEFIDTDTNILGYNPQGENNKIWSDFMNRYAVSPVPPSGKESSSIVPGKKATSTWDVTIPYDGTYGVQGTFSGKSGTITLSGRPVPGGQQIYDLQPSNADYGVSKATIVEGGRVTKLKTDTIQLTEGEIRVKVEVENDTAPGQKIVENKIFDAADWIDKIKDAENKKENTPEILCHAGGGYGGRKSKKQDKVGKVIVGSGGNGAFGGADEERGGAANGGGAGLRNGLSARSGKGDTLDGGFGVSFDGYEIGTDDEVRSGGDDTRIFTGGRLGQQSDDGGKGAFHGGGGGGSRGGGTGGSGGDGGVRITWGSIGKTLEFNKPGTYTAIVPRSSPGDDNITQVRMVCIGGGGSGHTDKSPGKTEQEVTGTAEFTVPIVTPFDYQTEYGTEYGVEVRNKLQKVEVYQEIRKVSGGGGSGGAYAYQNVKLPAGSVIQIEVGGGGRAQATGGSQDGEGSYVRVLKSRIKPEFVSIDKRTGTILNGEVIEKEIPDKKEYEGVTYKGPPIASYTKLTSSSGNTDRNRGEQNFANKMGPLISPFLPSGRLDTTANGKVSEFVWNNFNFPERDDYIFEAVADDFLEVFIGDALDNDNLIMSVSIEEGVKRVIQKVGKGPRRITLRLTNTNQEGTNYNLNPMYAGFKIYKEAIADDADKRSWRENPVGVSAVIIPPPCRKKIEGKGVVDDIIVTNVGNGYTTPPGTSYAVGLTIIGFDIVDPGINYSVGDRMELYFPNYPPIIIDPFYTGTPGIPPITTEIGIGTGIGTTIGIGTVPPPGDPPPLPPETPPTDDPVTGVPIPTPGPTPTPIPTPEPTTTTTFDGGGGPPPPGDVLSQPPDGEGGDGLGISEPEIVPQITLGGFGRFTTITVPPLPLPLIPPGVPTVRILSQTGINADIRPRIGIVRDPLGVPPENLIQVTDLVGLKQTGYIDGRPYYGQVFTIQGIKYAGVYGTVGELIQVYDTLQESIARQVTTPPSSIIRQGTDITQNDPRLNIPGTPETIE